MPIAKLNSADPFEEPDMIDGEPIINIRSVKKVSPIEISVEFDYGTVGEHATVLARGGAVEIDDRVQWAAGNGFRVRMFFPVEGGSAVGILIAESIGRTCPIDFFVHWLQRAGIMSNADHYCRLALEQVADRAFLEDLIKSANSVKVDLYELKATGNGSRTRRHRQLTQQAQTLKVRTAILGQVSKWFSPTKPGDAVLAIEGAVGLDHEGLGDAGLEFTNVAVHVENDGDRKVLRPDNIREHFTYQISDERRPNDQTWLEHTMSRARKLTVGDEIVLDVE